MLLIDEARIEINEIDRQMIELFVRRINAVKKVLKFKIDNNLEIFDEVREVELIKKNLSILDNKELEKYYLIFLDGVLSSSKEFQYDNNK